MDFASLRLLTLDVDGVLTPGSILMTPDGERDKTFHARDGLAIKLWQRSGGVVAIVTSRGGEAVGRRAKELGIEHLVERASDKAVGFHAILSATGFSALQAIYVGDDLPDLAPMSLAGLSVAVGDAAASVKQAAGCITRLEGGRGAVAEIVEFVLRKQKRWAMAKELFC